jgi:predicted RNA-binding Zn-ribbon protein involved in translation (DUF1610 family)
MKQVKYDSEKDVEYCPHCGSEDIYFKRTVDADTRDVDIYECNKCGKSSYK